MDNSDNKKEHNSDLLKSLLTEINEGNFNINFDIDENSNSLDAVVSGISILKQELEKSKISSAILESLLDTIPEMVITTDSNFNIIRTNSRFNQFLIRLCKNTRELNEIIEDSDFKKLKTEFKTKGIVKDIECIIGNVKNSVAAKITVLSIKSDTNTNESRLIIIKDQSQLKKIELELKQKNAELESFLYSASHHLKGPLATIMGLTNIVNDDTPIEEYKEYFNHIKSITKKLNDTLVDLVEFPKLGTYKITYEEIDISHLIDVTVDKAKNVGGFGLIPFEYQNNYQIDVSTISSKVAISSILQHLLENAFKYQKHLTDGSALIKIESEYVDDGVQISITDRGVGIKPEYQKRIFELFKTATPENFGTGLGLYIVKTQLERIGGKIDLYSMPNVGTTAIVWFPNATNKLKPINQTA